MARRLREPGRHLQADQDKGRFMSIYLPESRWTSVTPTIQAATYSANNCVGGLLTFANAMNSTALTGYIRSIIITDKSKQAVAYSLVLFSANPTGSTITDKAALSIAAADLSKLNPFIAVLSTDRVDFSATGFASVSSLFSGIKGNATNGTLYGALVTSGTPTYAGTSDITISLETIIG